MILMALQLLLIVSVLTIGLLTQALLIRQRLASWPEMVKAFGSLDGRLARLSYHEFLSVDLAVPPEDLYEFIRGREGLWEMYRNAGTLLEISSYLDKHCAEGALYARSRRQLRVAAAKARINLLLALPTPEPPKGASREVVTEAVNAYLRAVYHAALAINASFPERMPAFRLSVMGATGAKEID
jgi:hypothetical protein